MKQLLGEEKKEMVEKLIPFKLGLKANILLNPNTTDQNFLAALRDVCSLNLIRDEIEK